MADYPDYTDLMQIIGSDIMVPIDIQGAYIMMPVDIQAQYITLDIDIVAQTVGNISVDLVAQTVGNIEIDIAAQSIGDITISIDAQTVGVYLFADWSVVQGDDKNLYGTEEVEDATATTVLDYTVTAGKTFYICQWGFALDGDVRVFAALIFLHNATPTFISISGGNLGGSQSFTKPIAVVAGDHIQVSLAQWSGATEGGYATVGGYEI